MYRSSLAFTLSVVVAALVALPTLTACRSTGSPSGGALPCTLVYLRTGPETPPPEVRERLFAGHFENMQRLAEQKDLLLAGPFGRQKHAEDLRGLFVLDTTERERATELAETDPTFQGGVFVLEYHDLVTDAPLRQLLASELREGAQAEAAGRERPPGGTVRQYVLLTADRGDQARRALAAHPAVLLSARLDESRALFVIDAKPGEVVAKLGSALARIGPYVVDEWWGSKGLLELATYSP